MDSTIILIEAKVGEAWSNEQLQSKMKRLKRLNPENPKIYFVLASPKPQKRIETDEWPDWVFDSRKEPFWIKLDLPEDAKDWLRVTQCDEDRKSKANGDFWRLRTAGL